MKTTNKGDILRETQRMCCVCRQKHPRTQLIRITLSQGNLKINEGKQKYFGRSAYICKNKECLELAIKKRSLNRAFRREIPQETYEDLTKFI